MLWNGTDWQRPGPLEWLFKNYDDTEIDKGAWHTKQIVAELIQPGGKTIHYKVLELILFGIGKKSLNSRKGQSASLSYKKGIVITKAFSLIITYKILFNILLSSQLPQTYDITAGHLCWYWHNRSNADHIWCDFDHASSLICGNKMPTRCNRGFYCRSYCLLNMFRASLCPSSGAQEYYTVVAACGILCCKNVKIIL